ncbi:MAG: MoaD/ThiS family protein [Proteobacteria bacterium]|nr:MoaD/ThiS family protein [Pseudomonadota bacterium]
MLQVKLTGTLQSAVDDEAEVEIDAATIRELLTRLVERYPRMSKHLDEGIAVSINGEIYRDNWGTQIPDDAEVFLMPRIPGG